MVWGTNKGISCNELKESAEFVGWVGGGADCWGWVGLDREQVVMTGEIL